MAMVCAPCLMLAANSVVLVRLVHDGETIARLDAIVQIQASMARGLDAELVTLSDRTAFAHLQYMRNNVIRGTRELARLEGVISDLEARAGKPLEHAAGTVQDLSALEIAVGAPYAKGDPKSLARGLARAGTVLSGKLIPDLASRRAELKARKDRLLAQFGIIQAGFLGILVALCQGLAMVASARQRTAARKAATSIATTEATMLREPATGLPNAAGTLHFFAEGGSGLDGKLAILMRFAPLMRAPHLLNPTVLRTLNSAVVERLGLIAQDFRYLADHGQGQFFMLCNLPPDPMTGPPAILERVEQLLIDPVIVQNSRISLVLQAGYLATGTGRAICEIVEDAQIALDSAMRTNTRNRLPYSPDQRRDRESSRMLAGELSAAVTLGQFRAYFQPQINLRTGHVQGFEALIRWLHPTRGVIAPGAFLPLAEELGLDDALGEIMLNQGLEALRVWDSQGFDVAQVGLNFSQAQLANPKLVDTLKWELDRFDLTPRRLTVEVLENTYVENDADRIVTNVRGLAELGIGIDLDDFGTGTASITGIRRFRAHRIKIDRSFISDIDNSPDKQKMVAIMINMADGLGIETLAEGVETPAEIAVLRTLNCTLIQGYVVARPMPFESTLDWLSRHEQERRDRRRLGRSYAV